MTRIFAVSLALTVLAASGVGSADEAARATIEAACGTDLDVPPGICPCVADKAAAELDDLQQAWLAASMTKQFGDAVAMKDHMTPAQAIQAAMFLVVGAQACVR